MPHSLRRALLAELIGTFALVFFGPGAAVVDAQTLALSHVGVSLVFGLVVACIIAALSPISGAHINPAATFALVLVGEFPVRLALPYAVAQLSGAALAGLTLLTLFGPGGQLGVTLPAGSLGQAFLLETIMTCFLLLVALRSGLPWVVGGVVALEALMGGPITGASMNPARSFGPALASGIWTAHWLYWLAPLLGAGLAAVLSSALRPSKPVATQPQRAQEFSPEGEGP